MSFAYVHMHDMGAGWWLLMSLGMVMLIALAFGVVLSLFRARADDGPQPTPRETLDRRLADGEISPDEYERLRDAMRPPSGPAPAGTWPTHPVPGQEGAVMKTPKTQFTSKHLLGCLAVILVVLIAVVAGAGSGVLVFALLCPLMMGAMMWMMMGGRGDNGR